MIVVTIWSAANALEMPNVTFSTKLFWANVQYFSYCRIYLEVPIGEAKSNENNAG
jgi:hypothetical protein